MLVACLVLWHINLCKLFNGKSIFIQINRSISNNSVKHTKTVSFQAVLLQTI